jgi:hypothetical protein
MKLDNNTVSNIGSRNFVPHIQAISLELHSLPNLEVSLCLTAKFRLHTSTPIEHQITKKSPKEKSSKRYSNTKFVA